MAPTKKTRGKQAAIASLIGPQKATLGTYLTTMTTSPAGAPVPNLFYECAGDLSLGKRKVVSKTVFFWISREKPARGNAKELQPQTLTTCLRTFFGHMKDVYDWRFNFDKDFNFEGGLVPALNKLFADRRAVVGQKYGTAQNVAVM